MGNTCIPVVDSCWYMAKPLQYCKVKNKIKYIKKKKKKKESPPNKPYRTTHLSSLRARTLTASSCLGEYSSHHHFTVQSLGRQEPWKLPQITRNWDWTEGHLSPLWPELISSLITVRSDHVRTANLSTTHTQSPSPRGSRSLIWTHPLILSSFTFSLCP